MRFVKRLEEAAQQEVKKRKTNEKEDRDIDVESDDNHIYFYTEVTKESVLNLNKNILSRKKWMKTLKLVILILKSQKLKAVKLKPI